MFIGRASRAGWAFRREVFEIYFRKKLVTAGCPGDTIPAVLDGHA
jgi:hypothetical protein